MKEIQCISMGAKKKRWKRIVPSFFLWSNLAWLACDVETNDEANEASFRREAVRPDSSTPHNNDAETRAKKGKANEDKSPVCGDGVASPPLVEAEWLTDATGEGKLAGPIGGHKLSSGQLGLELKTNAAVAGTLWVVAHGPEGQTLRTEFDLETLRKGARKKLKMPIKKWLKGFKGGKAPVQVSYSSELYDHEGRFLRNEPGGVLYLGLKSKTLKGAKQAEEDWTAYDVESLQDFEEELTSESAQDPDPSALTPEDLAALDGFDPSKSRVVGLFDGGAGVLDEDPDHEGIVEPEGEPDEGSEGESGEWGEAFEADREGAAP